MRMLFFFFFIFIISLHCVNWTATTSVDSGGYHEYEKCTFLFNQKKEKENKEIVFRNKRKKMYETNKIVLLGFGKGIID